MARISEFEQTGGDRFEIAISPDEYVALANGFQLRLTAFDEDGNEATDTVNGGTLSFLLPTDQAQWTQDTSTGEYIYIQPVLGGSFSDNNHNVTYQGVVLSSVNSSGYDTVEQAYMIGGFNEPYNNNFATEINSSTFIEPGVDFTAVDQQNVINGRGDASVRWDAPNIDTPIVSLRPGMGDSGSTPPPCFVAGTMIACAGGERRVERLKVGDQVRTQQHGLQTIRWIGHRHFSGVEIVADEKIRPIRIASDALGPRIPTQDLLVSRQHRIVMESMAVAELSDAQRVLIAAHHLAQLQRISCVCPAKGVTYYHILFDRHEVIFANGVAAESFYLSKTAESAKCLSTDDLLDIEERGLLNDLVPPALPIPNNKLQREIVKQHAARARKFALPISARNVQIKELI
ncbi:Hint domain-containing protein [Sulfitobacter marinus]|uniref:Hint domain-containing protein n=1 Tax=Sulfitobacter marinus TaxID=394264 RepID=A0A1I6QZ17_9RHOB|nr:Hint domain-containing protein [Sulfitobacter marinus]SFS57610.1 Hint domain-containing protein [Sulfitobacter marinus]